MNDLSLGPIRRTSLSGSVARAAGRSWAARCSESDSGSLAENVGLRRHTPRIIHRLAGSQATCVGSSSFVASVILIRMSEQGKRVGRPRQWASEAERKRAYRSRKAAELADPLRQRQAAQDARTEAAIERSAATAAHLQAERWRRKAMAAEKRADAAEKRADAAEQRAVREAAAAHRFLAERDEARRLLRRKLQWAKHAGAAHLDSQELLAMVAELYAELTRLRKEIATLRRTVSSGR